MVPMCLLTLLMCSRPDDLCSHVIVRDSENWIGIPGINVIHAKVGGAQCEEGVSQIPSVFILL